MAHEPATDSRVAGEHAARLPSMEGNNQLATTMRATIAPSTPPTEPPIDEQIATSAITECTAAGGRKNPCSEFSALDLYP